MSRPRAAEKATTNIKTRVSARDGLNYLRDDVLHTDSQSDALEWIAIYCQWLTPLGRERLNRQVREVVRKVNKFIKH